MIGYRSIGESELRVLLYGENPIYGTQKWDNVKNSGCPHLDYKTVCFYLDNIRWIDKAHKFHIKVELPDNVATGTAVYQASSDFKDTKVFRGRAGKATYNVEEAYARCYRPEDIISLDIKYHYTDSYVRDVIIPFCKKYKIDIQCGGRNIANE